MKEGFSKSDRIKISNDGSWYLTIPFKYSAPNASGETGKPLPKEIHDIVKKQKTPLKESQIPENYNLRQLKELANGKKYQHKSSIYEGVKKNNNNGFINFRRVGGKSDPNSWIYPNLEGKNFFQQALDDIDNEIPILADNIINKFIEDIG